jgi:hypothetical protein
MPKYYKYFLIVLIIASTMLAIGSAGTKEWPANLSKVAGCSETPGVPYGNNISTYHNATFGFELECPLGWTIQEPGQNVLDLVAGFLAPGEDLSSIRNYVTVQVVPLPPDGGMTLDRYTQGVRKNLNRTYQGFNLLSEREQFLSGIPGRQLIYEMTSDGSAYRIMTVYAIRGDWVYALTYYALDDGYANCEAQASELMRSFEFTAYSDGMGQVRQVGLRGTSPQDYMRPITYANLTSPDAQIEDDKSPGLASASQTVGADAPNERFVSQISDAASSTAPLTSAAATTDSMAKDAPKTLVGSKGSNKYHHLSCKWAEKIAPQNRMLFSSIKEAESQGYVPCKACQPR